MKAVIVICIVVLAGLVGYMWSQRGADTVEETSGVNIELQAE